MAVVGAVAFGTRRMVERSDLGEGENAVGRGVWLGTRRHSDEDYAPTDHRDEGEELGQPLGGLEPRLLGTAAGLHDLVEHLRLPAKGVPGRADGSASERIADAVSRVLLPMSDTVFDLHSFSPTWDCPPSVIMHPVADADLTAKMVRVAEAFRLPVTLIWEHDETRGMFDGVAHNQGKVLVCSEFGGGTVSANSLAIYEAGVRSALITLGLSREKRSIQPSVSASPARRWKLYCLTLCDPPHRGFLNLAARYSMK